MKTLNSNVLLNLLIVILLVTSCSKVNEKTELSESEIRNIFTLKYLKESQSVSSILFNGSNYVCALFKEFRNNKIIILKEFGGTWQEILNHNEMDDEVTEIELSIIGKKLYLYFVSTGSGNTFGQVEFNLTDLDNNQNYKISFSGYVGQYDEMSPYSDELKHEKELLHFLEQKVLKSDLVPKPSQEDLNLDSPKNYPKMWKYQNERIYTFFKDNLDKEFPINWKEYNQNLEPKLEPQMQIENDYYIVNSFFKGNLIGFDKLKQKYFAIWIPESQYDWVEEMKFGDFDMIVIFQERQERIFSIDLIQKKIKRVY